MQDGRAVLSPRQEDIFLKHSKTRRFIPLVMLLFALGALCTGLPVLRWLRLYWRALPAWLFWPVWVAPPLMFASAGLLPRGWVKGLFRRTGEAWFGLFVYPMLLIALSEAVWLVCRLCGADLPLRESGWCVLALSGVLLLFAVPRALRPRITRYTVTVDKSFAPLRLALLSDLHLGFFTPRGLLPRIRELVNGLSPDMVLLAGDLFDEDYRALRHPGEAAAALAGLKSDLGTFACEGNHDLICPCPEQTAFFGAAHIRLLRDERTAAGGVTLAGRRDYRGPARLPAAELLAGADRARPLLVLDHNPRDSAAVIAAGADLVLCGHTHNGQTFPGNLLFRLLPWPVYGDVRLGGGRCIVTSGAGVWGFPVRLGARGEVVCIELRPAGPDR